MSDTRCPHCCAEYFRRRKLRTLDTWKLKFTCGSWLHPNGFTSQSDYCKALKAIRERDEARADAARLADILSGLELRSTEELARLEQERNEAREALMRIHGATCTLHTDSEISKMRCPICLKRERDEAREQNAKLRDISDGCLIALERATKYLPEYSRVNYEDALWRLRKKFEEETK